MFVLELEDLLLINNIYIYRVTPVSHNYNIICSIDGIINCSI